MRSTYTVAFACIETNGVLKKTLSTTDFKDYSYR